MPRYLHTEKCTETSMPRVESEPMIPVFRALDRAATDRLPNFISCKNKIFGS
jgi:hypothetical protein